MLRVCIASIQNVERSLLVVSASDTLLRTIKFFPVLFSSAYWSSRNKQTFDGASPILCDLHCMVVGNCFWHFIVRTSSNRSIASGAWPIDCVIYSASSSVNVFRTSHVQQSSIASYYTRIAISAYTPPQTCNKSSKAKSKSKSESVAH